MACCLQLGILFVFGFLLFSWCPRFPTRWIFMKFERHISTSTCNLHVFIHPSGIPNLAINPIFHTKMPVKWWISTAKTQLPAHQEIQPFRSPVCQMPPPVMAELLDEMIAFFVAEFQAVIYMIPANPKANPIISIEVQFYQKRWPVPKILSSKISSIEVVPHLLSLGFCLGSCSFAFCYLSRRWDLEVKPTWNRTENPKMKEFVPQKRDHF